MGQRKRAGTITQRSMDQNHSLLYSDLFILKMNSIYNQNQESLAAVRVDYPTRIAHIRSRDGNLKMFARVAKRNRAGPITQRSMDRNHPLLKSVIFNVSVLK